MEWIKGPRCGIDNCASQFYQIIGGQRVCQYGHVHVGLETMADDDDYLNMGRKISRPKSQASQLRQEKMSRIIHGKAAKLRVMELLQDVYRAQVQYVIAAKNLSPKFEKAARNVWVLYLTIKKYSVITMVDLVCVLYLATRAVDYPVTLVELLNWIRMDPKFPYFAAYKLLDRQKLSDLAAEHQKQFSPQAPPLGFRLHKTAQVVRDELTKKYPKLVLYPIDDRVVIYNLCKLLMLAPQVYEGALRVLQLATKQKLDRTKRVRAFEDITATCAVVVAAKLYHGLDGIPRILPENRADAEFSLNVWRDIMLKLWVQRPDFSLADERLVQYWTDDSIDSYLRWFQTEIGIEKVFDRRLTAMFPYPMIKASVPDRVDPIVVREMCALLHGTTSDVTDPVFTDRVVDAEELNIPVGSHYEVYSTQHLMVVEGIPKYARVLYELVAYFTGYELRFVMQAVRRFERRLKIQNQYLPPVGDDTEHGHEQEQEQEQKPKQKQKQKQKHKESSNATATNN